MNQTNHSPRPNPDDRLAEFTDHVLAGRIQQNASNSDDEQVLLEETILRLKNAFPPIALDEARVKQMQVRLKRRIQREAEGARAFPFPRFAVGVAAGLFALLIGLVLISPLFPAAGPPMSAAAMDSLNAPLMMVALAGLILLVIWLKRRK
jgi:hypothetical protein